MSLTVHQQRVWSLLQQAEGPMSAYTVLERLRTDGFNAPTQVYRALEKLACQGLVHRLESLNAYVACREGGCDADDFKAYAICDACGRVEESARADLGRDLRQWMEGRNFKLQRPVIELHGICRGCNPDRQGQD